MGIKQLLCQTGGEETLFCTSVALADGGGQGRGTSTIKSEVVTTIGMILTLQLLHVCFFRRVSS